MRSQVPTTARIVKFWIDVALIAGLAGFCLIALWLVSSPLIMAGSDSPGHVAIPIAIGTGSIKPVVEFQGAGPASGDVANPRIVDGRGELRFQTSSWPLQFFTNLVQLVGIAVVVYLLYLTRRVLKSALAGRPFALDSIGRVRIIGITLIALGFAIPLIEYAVAASVLARLNLAGAGLSPPIDVREEAVFTGLLLLVLAWIFSYGARLETDQSLTI